ncbi:MAG: amidohydrolase family protein [Halobacteriota archaeon]
MSGKRALSADRTVVDFGAHFYPEELDTSNRPGPEEEALAGYDRVHDPETQIAEMHAAGVDAAAVSMPYFLGHDDVDEAAHANDVLLEYTQEYDEYYGFASIPIAAGGEAAGEEFERSIDSGLHGGGVDETDVLLTDPEFEPVFEVADQTGAPVFVHVPSLPNVDYRFNAMLGREKELMAAIIRVVHSDVLDRYPDLNLVFHHLGGNIAANLGRVHLHTDAGRWPNQENMRPYEEFKRILEERIYVDTAGFFGYELPIRAALEEFPASQILFGTDIPWEPRSEEELRAFVEAVESSTTQEAADNILGGNALELLVNT